MRVRLRTKSILSIFAVITLSASCSSDPKETEEVVETASDVGEEEVELDDLASIEDAENEANDDVFMDDESGAEMAAEENEEMVTYEDGEELGDQEIAEEFEGDSNEEAIEESPEQVVVGDDTSDIEEQNIEAMDNQEEEVVENDAEANTAVATSEIAAAESMNSSNGSKEYIVRPGDSLIKISKIIYGDESRWKDLAAWNSINNPGKIYPGDSINYEEDSESARSFAAASKKSPRSVTVQIGDSLSKIAHKVFGDAGAWKYLWKMNGTISNPDKIFVGQTLTFFEPVELAALEMMTGSKVGQN